jgi:hypothetical protein
LTVEGNSPNQRIAGGEAVVLKHELTRLSRLSSLIAWQIQLLQL